MSDQLTRGWSGPLKSAAAQPQAVGQPLKRFSVVSSKTLKLDSAETRLVGQWIEKGGRVVADSTCERIRHLTEHVLLKIAISPISGAWETLFRDPSDGRLWERTYLHGDMHGGGPPSLFLMSVEDAAKKYGPVVSVPEGA